MKEDRERWRPGRQHRHVPGFPRVRGCREHPRAVLSTPQRGAEPSPEEQHGQVPGRQVQPQRSRLLLRWDLAFCFPAAVMGKRHLHSPNIYLLPEKKSCHPNLSAGPSVHVCVEGAAEMGFVLNTGEILYLLKQGQNNEHSSVNELDELPLSGK